MSGKAKAIDLTPEERQQLETWVGTPTTEQRLVQRACIVLESAAGRMTKEIARSMALRPGTVSKWRVRFSEQKLSGLTDTPRGKGRQRYSEATEKRILATLDNRPPEGYARYGRENFWQRASGTYPMTGSRPRGGYRYGAYWTLPSPQTPRISGFHVAQASATAARALAMISKGTVEIEAAIAVIDEEKCSGCKVCSDLCVYGAISFEEDKQVSWVNEALCKGCGVCVAACPSTAIRGKHFTTEQLMAEIEGILV